MKHFKLTSILLICGLLMGAGIPNFFSGLIGKNVHNYCEKPSTEQEELIESVNLYTGNHKVVVVCGEVVASSKPEPVKRSRRIAR